MFGHISDLVSKLELNIVESVSISARPHIRVPMPNTYTAGRISNVTQRESPDGKLWKHQSLALQALDAGQNLVVSTGTASGKSLIFQLYALHRLLVEPDSKVLVLYPLRALASDQFVSWQARAKAIGLSPQEVTYISSDLSQSDREYAIEQARIAIMTPDMCQAWLMRQVGRPFVSRFIEKLTLLVLDEAHVYESVFGSNLAFLVRRMMSSKRRLSSLTGGERRFQIVAATATISEPDLHLEQLTGVKFSVVEESANGAPQSKRQIIHVEGPDQGSDGENVVSNIIAEICRLKERHRFIAFMDSRQGVERISENVSLRDVKPYRSGYEYQDRAKIERALRDGTLHGVVSTSALELGIDIEDMEIGINLGVPESRKSFRQRLGRIGRKSPGVFLVIAPANAFKQFGENLSDYYDASVEPSYLYLGNRFIQFAHARCLRDEMEALSMSSSSTPAGARWPDGFGDILKYARETWPREFDDIAKTCGDTPHFNFPLRQIGETKISLKTGNKIFSRDIGDIAHHQAIREAFPGAHYLHNGRRYKVTGWNHGFAEIEILLQPATKPIPIRPSLRKNVTVDISQGGIVGGRVKRGKAGLVAEVEVQVTESVEGYRIGSTAFKYSDLRIKNPNMSREHRFFRTTGVVIKIEEDWFKNGTIREEVANGLYDLLCRDKSISPRDIDTASSRVFVRELSGPRPISDAIILYDSVYGGLRLTESLFDDIDDYMEQLRRAVNFAGTDAIVSKDTLNLLKSWLDSLDSTDLGESIKIDVPDGWFLTYKTGSIVSTSAYGGVIEREVIEPIYGAPFGTGEPSLNYFCKDPTQYGVKITVSHESIVPTGNDWEYILWNPDTGEYRDIED